MRFRVQALLQALILFCPVASTSVTDSFAASSLDGKWSFQSSTRKNNVATLPQGDSAILTVKGTSAEVVIIPGNPGLVETVIKNLCHKLHTKGKVTFRPGKSGQPGKSNKSKAGSALFHVTEVRGEGRQEFCPAERLLGELGGKEIADKLRRRSLKFDVQYKIIGKTLILTTTYRNEKVSLEFLRQ